MEGGFAAGSRASPVRGSKASSVVGPTLAPVEGQMLIEGWRKELFRLCPTKRSKVPESNVGEGCSPVGGRYAPAGSTAELIPGETKRGALPGWVAA